MRTGFGAPGHERGAGLDLADARAARSYLASRRDLDPGRLIYFGESLGAAVALGLALEAPPAALVLRSPFTSLAEVAKFQDRGRSRLGSNPSGCNERETSL